MELSHLHQRGVALRRRQNGWSRRGADHACLDWTSAGATTAETRRRTDRGSTNEGEKERGGEKLLEHGEVGGATTGLLMPSIGIHARSYIFSLFSCVHEKPWVNMPCPIQPSDTLLPFQNRNMIFLFRCSFLPYKRPLAILPPTRASTRFALLLPSLAPFCRCRPSCVASLRSLCSFSPLSHSSSPVLCTPIPTLLALPKATSPAASSITRGPSLTFVPKLICLWVSMTPLD